MFYRTLTGLVILVCILAVNPRAHARDAAGGLTFIQSPLSTAPQFVQPGGTITVDVAERIYNNCACAFRLYLLVDNQQMELGGVMRGTDPATSTYRFTATIPAGLETGLYDLIAVKGANRDNALRAVAVHEDYPTEFSILHIHDPLVATGGATGHLLELTAGLAGKNKTAFAVITGTPVESLNQQNTIRFFEITDKFPVPTFVADPSSKPSFGALPQTFTFADSLFLVSPSLGDAPGKSCAESVIRDFAAQGSHDSLYFGSDGTIYHVIPNTRDDDCLKALKDSFVTPPLDQGKVRLLTFKDGKLMKSELISINP